MKALTVLLGAVLVSGAMVNGQEMSTPKFEVWLNYSWLHSSYKNYGLQSARTGSGYCEHNVNKTAGPVLSFRGYADTRMEIDELLMPSLFVPGFNSRRAVMRPYTQFLFDGAQAWNGPAGVSMELSALATSAEEFDYRRAKQISIKPIQMKYVLTKSANGFGSFQNDVGYSAGVVFTFRGQQ